MRVIIVTAVEAEARSIEPCEGVSIVVAGVGRTNAAAATTEAILKQWQRGGVDAVISAGVAGALPDSSLGIGDVVLASACVYVEEGLIGPGGFSGMAGLGFKLGDFEGNTVPVDEDLLDAISAVRATGTALLLGPIATVATCSGTDEAAAEVVRRTGALAEAMEGAAVVHAARRLKVPAIEIRAISNTTGDRKRQQWDLQRGFEALGQAMAATLTALRAK